MVAVTGLGSLPGDDLPAALRFALEGPEQARRYLPYLPELPARGPWAGMIGRGTALLSGLAVELSAGEWRLSGTSGIDHRRARATLRDDVDRLEEAANDLAGPLTLSIVGPLTLAASLFRPLGGRVVGDRGARRDVAQSLAEGVTQLRDDLDRRLPALELAVQVDEPWLPAVLAGRVPTEGGFFRHRSVGEAEAAEYLAGIGPGTVSRALHCCAPGLDLELVRRGGFEGVSLDAELVTDWDEVAGWLDQGRTLMLGCLPATPPVTDTADTVARRVLGVLRPLGLGPAILERLTLTPSCGLAGVTTREASTAMAALARAGSIVEDELHR